MRIGPIGLYWRPYYRSYWFIGKRPLDYDKTKPIFDIHLGRFLLRLWLH